MSDSGEVEVEVPTNTYPVLPKEVTSEIGSIKLFNKWSYEDVEIRDISLTYVMEDQSDCIDTDYFISVIISKFDRLSISPTPPADMPQSDSEKHNARSSND